MNIPEELLKSCIKKDRKAQFQLYRNCFSILMSVCLRYEKNREDATSLLNLGYLKILTNLEKYNTQAPFEAWIRRIMINVIIDEYRKNRKQSEMIEFQDLENSELAGERVEWNEADRRFDAEELQGMLEELPPISQKVFNLHVIDGYSHKEIAQMLEISDGTSKWHVSYARQRLRELVQKKLKLKKIGVKNE